MFVITWQHKLLILKGLKQMKPNHNHCRNSQLDLQLAHVLGSKHQLRAKSTSPVTTAVTYHNCPVDGTRWYCWSCRFAAAYH